MAAADPVQFNASESPQKRERSLLKKLPDTSFVKDILLPAGVIILVVLLGAGTGWKLSAGQGVAEQARAPGAEVEQGGKEVGIKDPETFRDNAQGVLEKGGIDGEGTHHLVREGGPSQNVYLTSSVIDLEQFVSKKVEVWGETFAGEKAGWLMDVGRIKILE